MMTKSDMDKRDVLGLVLKAPDLMALFEEIKEYNDLISQKAVRDLLKRELAINSWSMFTDALNNFPQTIPIGEKRLSDYPVIIEKTQNDGFDSFYHWLEENVDNDNLLEQAILRNIFHFFEFTIRMGDQLPEDALELMRDEFKVLNYTGYTSWLSRFYNGLQNCVMEVYIANQIVSKYLD